VVCSADGNQIANYTGGSGTLNDGLTATDFSADHLFVMRPADDGLRSAIPALYRTAIARGRRPAP